MAALHRGLAGGAAGVAGAIVLREGAVPADADARWSRFSDWSGRGLGLVREFRRHAPVELRVGRLDTIPRPFATAAVVRWISRGPIVVRASDGEAKRLGWRQVASLGARAIADAALAPALLRRARARCEALESMLPGLERTAWRGVHDGPPFYLRTEPWYGVSSGGSIAHTAGVVSGLVFEAGTPIVVVPERPPLLSEVAEIVLLDPPHRFWDYPELRLIECDEHFGRQALAIAAARRPGFVYHRYAAFSTAGIRVAFDRRIPLVLEYNGSEVWIRRHWGHPFRYEHLARRIEDQNLRAADLVAVVSTVLRDELVARSVEPERIVVAPNGVDTDRFRPDLSGEEVRERYALGSDLVIGFVGTFGPWHGAGVLARAFVSLAARIPRLRLLLIGDGEERPVVEQLLAEQIAERRAVLAGAVAADAVPVHLAACDVLVAAHVPNPDGSEFFGSPTKLFEYMAAGRAIVASRLGQLAEVLDHERTALLVEPGNPDDLARAIERLVRDAGLRVGLAEAARKAAVDRHGWREHTRRIVDALRKSRR